MGMLAFTDSLPETKTVLNEEPVSPKYKSRPQSILGECINYFHLQHFYHYQFYESH